MPEPRNFSSVKGGSPAAAVGLEVAAHRALEEARRAERALLVVDWRADLPAPVELAGEVESMWSLSAPRASFAIGVDLAAKEANA